MQNHNSPILSVVIATYNEEKNITSCLNSVKNIADEIIIVDGQSGDDTVKLAKKFNTKIYIVPNQPDNFHANKQLGLNKATGNWILQIDADERVSKQLAKEIKVIITNPKSKDGYNIPRKNWFLTKFLTKGGVYPDYVVRLFRKNKGFFPKDKIIDNGITTSNVHAQIQIKGNLGYLNQNLIHYGDKSFDRYLSRLNRYTTIEADNLITNDFKINFINAIHYIWIKPTYWFLKRFIRHRGYVDGFAGFAFALFSAFHYPIIYIKIWNKIK